MNDSVVSSSKPASREKRRSFLERLSQMLTPEPETRAELLSSLHNAHTRNLLDADALSMIEGVFQMADLCARDVMVPRAQMDAISIADHPNTFMPFVQNTNHSRFPVYEESNRDRIIGILLAKDLLRYYTESSFNVRDYLRPAVFIPEAKPLNELLRDFRANRNHMAIVVDEYGGVAGLVTIEDVLEQIVGDIEDEYDFDDDDDNITLISPDHYRVSGLTEIEQLNDYFGTCFSDDASHTLGGLISKELGRLPKRGETVILGNLKIEMFKVDSRQIHTVLVSKIKTIHEHIAD